MQQAHAASTNWRRGPHSPGASLAPPRAPPRAWSWPGDDERPRRMNDNWREHASPLVSRTQRRSCPGAERPAWMDDWRRPASTQQNDRPEEVSTTAASCVLPKARCLGRRPETQLVPGKICYLHKGISSDALHEQVDAWDYDHVLGHPVVILPFPAKRPGCKVVAKLTTFGGRSIDERYCSPGQEHLKPRYLPISHGKQENYGHGRVLHLENGNQLLAQTWVNAHPRDLLEIETVNLPAFQMRGAECQLTKASVDLLERYCRKLLEGLHEDERFRFGVGL
ncbi:hypothetical protein BKA81DRAFT_433145 [Phyllosticta paracitricarpa]